jgi:hypothetical protein
MAVKKNSYITDELEWAEEKLAEWRQYIDANPIASLQDRVQLKQTANGGAIPMVIASIESQVKSLRDTMKEYLALLEVVDKLREKEELKAVARGSQEINGKMKKFA